MSDIDTFRQQLIDATSDDAIRRAAVEQSRAIQNQRDFLAREQRALQRLRNRGVIGPADYASRNQRLTRKLSQPAPPAPPPTIPPAAPAGPRSLGLRGAGGQALGTLLEVGLPVLAEKGGSYLGNRAGQGLRAVAPPGSPANPIVKVPPWYPPGWRPPGARPLPAPQFNPIPGGFPTEYKAPPLGLPPLPPGSPPRRGAPPKPGQPPTPAAPPKPGQPPTPGSPFYVPSNGPFVAPDAPPGAPGAPTGTPGPRPPGPPFRGGQTAAAYLVRIDYKGNPPDSQDASYEVTVWGPIGGLQIIRPSAGSNPARGSDCYLRCHGDFNFGGPRLENQTDKPISFTYDDAGTWSIGLIQKIPGTDPLGDERPDPNPPPDPNGQPRPRLAPPDAPQPLPPDAPPGPRPYAPPRLAPPDAPSGSPAPKSPPAPFPFAPPGPLPFPLPLAFPLGMPAGNPGPGGKLAPPGARPAPGAPGASPAPGSRPNPSPQPQPQPPGQPPFPGTEPPTPLCRYDSSNIAGGVNVANQKLDRLDSALQVIQTVYLAKIDGTTTTINDKLGPQLPNGGISGKLGVLGNVLNTVKDVADRTLALGKKIYERSGLSYLMTIMTYITVLHNAYMLSSNIGRTLFSAMSLFAKAFGIEDSEGNAIDVEKIFNQWMGGFFASILGVETLEGIKREWAKYNRIYQAATNLLFTIQSMMYSMLDAMEVVGNYVAKIGNAAKIFGVFAENCYGWMNVNLNFTQNRFFNALNNAQEAVENLEVIASSVVEIQDLAEELYGNKEALARAMNSEEKKVEKAADTGKTASKSPEIPKEAEQKPNS